MMLKPIRKVRKHSPRSAGIAAIKSQQGIPSGRARRPRWREAPNTIPQDLEREAWPKNVPYVDMANGAQIGTLPERRVLWWLVYRSKLSPNDFEFQTDFLGGRARVGGGVADFVIYSYSPGGVMVWEVLGEEWHSNTWQRNRDYTRRMIVTSTRFHGLPVVQYIEMWEHDINFSDARRDELCEAALAGIQIGGRLW